LDLIEGLNPDDYMWYTLRGQGRMRWRKTPMGDSTFDRWYRRCLDDAGITRYLNPHQTRHTFGHRLREADFSLEERKVLMGHEKIATTDYYYGTLTI
jgi:integrase